MSRKIAKVSIELEIKTTEYLTDDELFAALNSLKNNMRVWLEENDYPSDGVQESIDSELVHIKVL